jgi:drug/metabolite transporter (DMT)-like permease
MRALDVRHARLDEEPGEKERGVSPIKGIALKIAATFVFVVMGVLVKWLGETVPTGQVVFARSFFAFLPLFLFLAWRREFVASFRVTRPGLHALRVVAGSCGMLFSFAALIFIPLTDQVAIGYAMPIFAVIFAAFILGEAVRVYRWSAVAVGLVGVAVILWPHLAAMAARVADEAATGAALALAAAVASALATICVRLLTKTESTGSIIIYFTIGTTILGLLTLPIGWVMPSALEAAALIAVGVLGGCGQILHTLSYRHGDASLIAPFEYASLLWAVALGFLIFGDAPTVNVLVGAAIVVAAGLFVIWREHQLGLAREREQEVAKT